MRKMLQRVMVASILVLAALVWVGPAAASTYNASGVEARRSALQQALSKRSSWVELRAPAKMTTTKAKATPQPKKASRSSSGLPSFQAYR